MISLQLNIQNGFTKKLQNRASKYQFMAGVLNDKPHRVALPASAGLSSYRGGPTRKMSRATKGNISDVSKSLRRRFGFNYLTAPFDKDGSPDVKKVVKAIMNFLLGRGKEKSIENAMRAAILNPILKREYGSNSSRWIKVKRFNRKMVDTGQLIRNITSQVRKRR